MTKRFPLAAVLTVREQKEAAEERALGAVNADLQKMRAALAMLERELAQLAASRTGERDQVFLAAHFHAVVARHDTLRAQQAEVRQQVKMLEARRAEQQARFLAARRDREMVTQLGEKHENSWKEEKQRQENKRIDDLFSTRRVRLLQTKI